MADLNKMFKPAPINPHAVATVGQAGYDNPREVVDDHVKTKVITTKELNVYDYQIVSGAGNVVIKNGMVGIGTMSPTGNLQVHTTAGSNPTFKISDGDVSQPFTSIESDTSAIGKFSSISSTSGGMSITGYSSASARGLLLRGLIGSSNPDDTMPAIDFWAGKSSGTTGADLGALETAYQFNGWNGITNYVTILGSGNVGIGTTAPGAKLEVVGENILVNQDYARLSLGNQYADGDVHFGSSGAAAPANGLQDYGFYAAHNAYRGSDGQWYHSREITVPAVRYTGGGGVSTGTSGFRWDYSANNGANPITWTNLMVLTTAGNVGIGTTSPSSKLEVSGSFTTFSGAITGDWTKSGAAYIPNIVYNTQSGGIVASNYPIGTLLVVYS